MAANANASRLDFHGEGLPLDARQVRAKDKAARATIDVDGRRPARRGAEPHHLHARKLTGQRAPLAFDPLEVNLEKSLMMRAQQVRFASTSGGHGNAAPRG
jgi:hypothetical protein